MPRPHQKTRSTKKRMLKLPSGSGSTIHYKKSKANATHCANCGRTLFGTPLKMTSDLKRLPSSYKGPQRMFGGQLCHTCLQESLKQAVRSSLHS